jgi:hypothetical protein
VKVSKPPFLILPGSFNCRYMNCQNSTSFLSYNSGILELRIPKSLNPSIFNRYH